MSKQTEARLDRYTKTEAQRLAIEAGRATRTGQHVYSDVLAGNWNQIGARAVALLQAAMGVTRRYALAAVETGEIDAEDLRGHGPRGAQRWYLA